MLTLGYPGGASPGDEERAFVEAVADQTALVVENSRLYQRASSAAALEERPVSYTPPRAPATVLDLVCRLLLGKKKKKNTSQAATSS